MSVENPRPVHREVGCCEPVVLVSGPHVVEEEPEGSAPTDEHAAFLAEIGLDGTPEGEAIRDYLIAEHARGLSEGRRQGRDALTHALDALRTVPIDCRFHGAEFDRSGMQHGLPRCETCRQPYLVVLALKLVRGALDD